MQICRNPVWEFSISEGRLINLGDFVQRLSAIGAQATFDLRKPLREAVGDVIQSRFSPSAREIAASFVWPKIQPQFDSALVGYDDLSREWSRFDEIREGANGGIVDLAKARSNATGWGLLSIIVTLASMTIAVSIRIGTESEGEAGPAFFVALLISFVVFLFHAGASAELKRGNRQVDLAGRYGASEEDALRDLEGRWENRRNDFEKLQSALDIAVKETSSIRSVRKATAYDDLVEAESAVLQQAQLTNISYTDMMGAQAAIAGAMTPQQRLEADRKYRSAAQFWRVRQSMLAEAEARARLLKIEYEGI